MTKEIKKSKEKAPAKKVAAAPEWHVIDASSAPLGRIATQAAILLQGKHRVDYAPNKVAPVNVVITNTDSLKVTGKKMEQKKYYRYSGYPGGLYERSLRDQMGRDSRLVLTYAIGGMLPKNNLRDDRLAHLKLYTGAEHPHTQVSKSSPSTKAPTSAKATAGRQGK